MKAKIYKRKNCREIDTIELFSGDGVKEEYVGCVFNPKNVEFEQDYRLVICGQNRPVISYDSQTRLSWRSADSCDSHTFMRVAEIEYIYKED